MKVSDLIATVVEEIVAGVGDARERGVDVYGPSCVDFEVPLSNGTVTRFSVTMPDVQSKYPKKTQVAVAVVKVLLCVLCVLSAGCSVADKYDRELQLEGRSDGEGVVRYVISRKAAPSLLTPHADAPAYDAWLSQRHGGAERISTYTHKKEKGSGQAGVRAESEAGRPPAPAEGGRP